MDKSTDVEVLLKQADDLFEARRFAEARDEYRAIALAVFPGEYVLQNLRVADEQEVFLFSRTLVERHPESILAWRYLLDAFIQAGKHWYDHVILHCTNLLKKAGLDTEDELGLKRLRILAILRGGVWPNHTDFSFMIDDFFMIWNAGERRVWGTYLRSSLLDEIVSVHGIRHIAILESIASHEGLPAEVSQLLGLKIAELKLLDSAGPDYR